MTTFDSRETGFENKFAHDAELEFRIFARRNKLLGLWAADLLGMTAEDADTYAKSVVQADFEHAGHEDVFRKVLADLKGRDVATGEAEVRAAMETTLTEARRQLLDVG